MRLTRNSIALSGNFGKIDPRIHFDVKILKNVKIDLGLFFPNCPQSHAITSTNYISINLQPICSEKEGPAYMLSSLTLDSSHGNSNA